MGKRHKAKTGGVGKALDILEAKKNKKNANMKSAPVREVMYDDDEDDDYVDDRGNMLFDKKNHDDEDEDEEVFALNDDDDEDEDEYDDIDDDDEDEDDEIEGDLGDLVKSLDPKLRNKILAKRRSGINDDDDDDDLREYHQQHDHKLDKWGKKKDYYSGDTADLEIGQEFDDAEEEEAAAKEMMKEKISRMKAKDFFDMVGNDDAGDDDHDDEDDDEEDIQAFIKKNMMKSGKWKDKMIGDLESLALGGNQASMQVEDIHRDFTKLTTDQKVNMLKKDSPELEGILHDLHEKASELKDKIDPLTHLVSRIISFGSSSYINDDIVDYLHVKQQLLLSYCMNVMFYLYMKSLGLSVAHHPVMRQLLELRYCMEKMRSLDHKLKYQIDRLIQLQSLDDDAIKNATLRPNMLSMLDDDDEDEDNDDGYEEKKSSSSRSKNHDKHDNKSNKKNKSKKGSYNLDNVVAEEDDEEITIPDSDDEKDSDDDHEPKKKASSEVYRPPKLAATRYHDDESKAEKHDRKLELQRKKLRNSEILQSMREEFGDDPESSSSTGVTSENAMHKEIEQEEDERRDFEEDRFIRLTMTRKDKQSIKRRKAEASRLDNLESIGDIGEFEEFSKLMKQSNKFDKSSSKPSKEANNDDDDNDDDDMMASKASSSAALQRTVNAFSQKISQQQQKKNNKFSTDEDVVDIIRPKKKASKMSMVDDDDNDDRYDGHYDEDEEHQPSSRRRAPLGDDNMDDNNLLEAFTMKKRKFLSQKQEHYTAEPRYGGYEEAVDDGEKRAASYEMITNRGLTPHRSKVNRNARVKKRVKYDKALIRRKGAVQSVRVGEAAAYGGEMTGIKSNISRSRKF